MTWADKARLCVDWRDEDQARLGKLDTWLEPEVEDMCQALVDRLSALNGVQPLMRNARFARRLQDAIREWLTGLVKGPFDVDYEERRRELGRRLANLDLSFEDVIFLEGVTSRRLFSLARRHLDGRAEELSMTMCALNKAMTRDRALIHAGYLDLHDAELEQALLDRFLAITGFSPSLYEGLAETWRWNQRRGGRGSQT